MNARNHTTGRKCGAVQPGSAWALVTGAGSGIGRCYALRLAALGYNLVLAGNRAEPLETVRREIEGAAPGIRIRTVAIDLARIGLGIGFAPDYCVAPPESCTISPGAKGSTSTS